MTAYYNEIDPYAAQWLRTLIAGGHIAPGDVDERSIADVQPDDLAGYTQVHFFAGIGGWSLALRLAGWPDDRPVWTGSCPCQPFSAAGKGVGFADERHLWPAFFRLIRERRPDSVLGEQVASNLAWYDLVSGDMEGEGYAVGAAIVGAHSVGAPHIRQRLYWVAQSDEGQRGRQPVVRGHERDGAQAGWLEGHGEPESCGEDGGNGVADSGSQRRQQVAGSASSNEGAHGRRPQGNHQLAGAGEDFRNRLAYNDGQRCTLKRRGGLLDGERPALRDDADGCGEDGRMGDADDEGLEGWRVRGGGRTGEQSAWEAGVLIPCADGRWRPVPTEPGLFPLAHGVPGRVGRLRAYGNAIVPQVAAAFIRAVA